ncbi:MAG: DegT/DnrJ/EryC1/StrS family aminotransferase [Planctomycetes bacterium]|nr:DegT/DnrJ/EryC1/StrS family aminotransferase [Planctomycetota bacterium]
MTVPLLDLKAQYATIRDEIRAAVDAVLESQQCILGATVAECEAKLAEYCRCPHAVGVSSGSDALLISLMAEGIGPGDEVITTPYTFFATAGVVARLGAKPVFVDIDPQTYNIDPAGIEARITPDTKAVLPVHLYGQCADMDPIMALADGRGIPVVEDAAQAIGSEYKGRRAGSMGRYGCFSFFPSKNLGAAGDGGLVTTRDDAAAEKLRVLRAHGSKPKYYHALIGGNFRFDALQAAIVAVKLRHLDQWTAGRQSNAARYRRLFEAAGLTAPLPSPAGRGAGGEGLVRLPVEVEGCRHIYNQFVIRAPRRDELRAYLKEHKIGNEVYYPVPLHVQKCFDYLGYKEGDFPESEKAARETIALPIYPELSDRQAEWVVECIGRFFERLTKTDQPLAASHD